MRLNKNCNANLKKNKFKNFKARMGHNMSFFFYKNYNKIYLFLIFINILLKGVLVYLTYELCDSQITNLNKLTAIRENAENEVNRLEICIKEFKEEHPKSKGPDKNIIGLSILTVVFCISMLLFKSVT